VLSTSAIATKYIQFARFIPTSPSVRGWAPQRVPGSNQGYRQPVRPALNHELGTAVSPTSRRAPRKFYERETGARSVAASTAIVGVSSSCSERRMTFSGSTIEMLMRGRRRLIASTKRGLLIA
jgi:hypothetical protein